MFKVMFDPRLSKRLQATYKLERPPTTLTEFVELGRALIQASPDLQEYIGHIKSGDVIVGETEEDRGQSIVFPNGREVRVMCGYDALTTLLLRGQGVFNASCLHCGAKMEVKIDNGKVFSASSPTIVYWFGDGPKGIPICDHLNLFPDLDHLLSWLETNPEELGVPLLLHDAADLLQELHTLRVN
jgi:hypothetical protein